MRGIAFGWIAPTVALASVVKNRCIQLRCHCGNARIACRSVMAAAGVKPHPIARTPHQKTVAIVFDFVKLLRTGRDGRASHRNARLISKLTHGLDVGRNPRNLKRQPGARLPLTGPSSPTMCEIWGTHGGMMVLACFESRWPDLKRAVAYNNGTFRNDLDCRPHNSSGGRWKIC